MPTTRSFGDEYVVERTESGTITLPGLRSTHEELPPLTTADRVALRLGLALILWSRRPTTRLRPADRAIRAEQARLTRGAEHSASSRGVTFDHRYQAGPRW